MFKGKISSNCNGKFLKKKNYQCLKENYQSMFKRKFLLNFDGKFLMEKNQFLMKGLIFEESIIKF